MNTTLLKTMLIGKYSEYFTISNMFSGIVRQGFQVISKGINFIVKPTDDFLLNIYKYATGTNFARNSKLFVFFKQFNPILITIFALCLVFLLWNLFLNPEENKDKINKFLQNLIIAFCVVIAGANIFIQVNNFTMKGIKFIDISESTQGYGRMVKGYTYDLAYLCQNITSDTKIDNNALKSKNNLPVNFCKNLDPTEVIENPEEIITKTKHPSLSDVQEVLNQKVYFNNATGEIGFTKLSNGFFGIGKEGYYRYKINYFMIITTQLCNALVLLFTAFAVIRRVFEATCAFGMSYIVAFADLNNGKRLKELLKFILNAYLTILATAFCYKIYFFFMAIIPDSFNLFAKLAIMIVLTFVMIDGPTYIEKILTGQDAGIGDGFRAASQVSHMLSAGKQFGSTVRGSIDAGKERTSKLANYLSNNAGTNENNADDIENKMNKNSEDMENGSNDKMNKEDKKIDDTLNANDNAAENDNNDIDDLMDKANEENENMEADMGTNDMNISPETNIDELLDDDLMDNNNSNNSKGQYDNKDFNNDIEHNIDKLIDDSIVNNRDSGSTISDMNNIGSNNIDASIDKKNIDLGIKTNIDDLFNDYEDK